MFLNISVLQEGRLRLLFERGLYSCFGISVTNTVGDEFYVQTRSHDEWRYLELCLIYEPWKVVCKEKISVLKHGH